MVKDMTQGAPGKILWSFSLPLLFSVIFQQMYSIVDSVVAGKFVGVGALAAVGASYPITMIFIAIATGANIGSSVIISQYFGAKKYEDMKTAVYTSILSVVALSLILTVAGTVYCNPLMRMLDTPADVFGDGALYLRIYIWGLLFLFLYNICTGVFTALGDSRTPLYFLIGSSVSNIVFDLIFVISFRMDVAGVAWATFLCQGVASLLAILTLIRRLRKIKTSQAFPVYSFRMLGRISIVAVPSILQQSFISIGNLFVQRLVNGYGSTVMASYSAVVKLNTFAITSFTTMANGLSSFTAQNMGAMKSERVQKGFRAGVRMILLICVPFFIAYFVFSPAMIRVFLSSKEDVSAVIQEGTRFLRIVSPFYFVISLKLMADGVLRGAGAMAPFMVATFSDLILRVVLSYVMALGFSMGSTGIWLSWPIGWVIGTVLSLGFYLSGIWKRKMLIQEREETPADDSDVSAELAE
ncbi:MATE family efflux transporter [Diplocloster modestus]|uniref:MATE family efflux transporter n=1 Tax=Diplocloster modestus TaxID=2850322 RepID=A0ABS6K3M7_9FIRM|nr:MATE family efflux transporter [Diplocloster modestus]MBU9725120.1 MATE family efflux transporter [Diplocloster modestus]